MSGAVSDVQHYEGLAFWGPYDEARMDRLLALLRLRPGDRFLDVGCGKAELLLRATERYGVSAVGVDRSPFALDQARAAFAARAPDATPAFLETDAGSYDAGPDAVDAVAWLGGPYVGATFAETLAALRTWVRPGGALLIGQGIWTGTPPPAFLESTGIPAEEFSDHAGLLDLGLSLGLRVLYTCVSSRDEWDHFEGTLRTNSERYALEHPDAPDPHGRLEAGRAFYLAQQRWGRQAMGFALTVFARPLEPSSRVRVRG